MPSFDPAALERLDIARVKDHTLSGPLRGEQKTFSGPAADGAQTPRGSGKVVSIFAVVPFRRR